MMENEIKKQTLAVAVAMAIAAMTYGEAAAPADELARARQKETVIVPEAPEGYRRPKDWRPVLYPKSLREISRDHSAETLACAVPDDAKVTVVGEGVSLKAEKGAAGLVVHLPPAYANAEIPFALKIVR